MFDNLREQANSTPFYEDEAQFQSATGVGNAPPRSTAGGRFLGMTAPQRFAVAVMLMIIVCVLGTMVLLVTGRIGLL